MVTASAGEPLQLRPPELHIDESDPFSSDRLARKEFAEALLQLVRSTRTCFVLNLDAPWGQGKTTFLGMWRQLLKVEGVNSLYFNAWETDFSSDPLIALIGELSAGMVELRVNEASDAARHLQKIKKISGSLIKRSIPVAVRLATMGVVDLPELTETALADFSQKVADDQIKHYEESKKSILGFRSELEAFAKALANQTAHSQSEAPLVLIIDELDRCRPDYAVRVLETIKHLFYVPGVFFVIATDSHQLANVVRHTYGTELDAESYLRRFFDVAMTLPQPDMKKFVEAQFERFGFNEFFERRTHGELRYDKDQARSVFAALSLATECSLRDCERCFTLLGLAIGTTPENHYLHPIALCTLIVLRVKNPALYTRYIRGDADSESVVKYFSSTRSGRKYFESDRGYGSVIESSLICMMAGRRDSRDISKHYEQIAENESVPEVERSRARRIANVIGDFQFQRMLGSFNIVVQKIELVSSAVADVDD